MTNEDQIEEILIKAEEHGIRSQVIELSLEMRINDPSMNRIDSIEQAYKSLKSNIK